MDMMFHAGLGDAFICNAIVRNYCKIYDYLNIFVVKNNSKTIKYMFRDIKNLNYITWGHDRSIIFDGYFTEENSDFLKWYNNNLKIGLDGLLGDIGANQYSLNGRKIIRITNTNPNITFDRSFYEIANLDFEKKWIDFYMERDLEEEKRVYYDVLGLKEDEKFIFIHDDKTRGYSVDENKINLKEIKHIRPDNKEIPIYNFLYTLEKAEEIHCMNSSFICLIDTIQLKTNKLYYHRYVRGTTDLTFKLDWKILQ